MAELIAEIILYVLPTLLAAVGGFFGLRINNTRRDLKNQSEFNDLEIRLGGKISKLSADLETSERERGKLKIQVESQSTIINDLRQQTQELAHFKLLYETLKESHEMLKSDHEQLKSDFNDEKTARADELDERNRLAKAHEQLRAAHDEVVQERDRLVIENRVYQTQWLLLGEWITETVGAHSNTNKQEPNHEGMDVGKPSSSGDVSDDGVDSDLHAVVEGTRDDSVGDGGDGNSRADAG